MGKQLVQSIGFMKFDFKSGIHADRKRLEMFLLGGESLGCVCVCVCGLAEWEGFCLEHWLGIAAVAEMPPLELTF